MSSPSMESIPKNLHIFESVREDSPDFDISDPDILLRLEEQEKKHFWHQCRCRMIRQFMAQVAIPQGVRILEIGCGGGNVLEYLHRHGYRIEGTDMHAPLCRRAALRCPEVPVYVFDVRRPPPSFEKRDYGAVLLFDVLEHIDDSAAFLSACARFVPSGGYVIGTVPALMGLWSNWDAQSTHKRRYTRATLRQEILKAGLSVVHLSYFFRCLVPLIWFQRRYLDKTTPVADSQSRKHYFLQSMSIPSRPVNQLLGGLCDLERLLSLVVPLDALPGSSLFFAARKP